MPDRGICHAGANAATLLLELLIALPNLTDLALSCCRTHAQGRQTSFHNGWLRGRCVSEKESVGWLHLHPRARHPFCTGARAERVANMANANIARQTLAQLDAMFGTPEE